MIESISQFSRHSVSETLIDEYHVINLDNLFSARASFSRSSQPIKKPSCQSVGVCSFQNSMDSVELLISRSSSASHVVPLDNGVVIHSGDSGSMSSMSMPPRSLEKVISIVKVRDKKTGRQSETQTQGDEEGHKVTHR